MTKKQIPMYTKIYEELRAKINATAIDYDAPFCTEKSICEKYNVSRITAKRAIDDLEKDGFLYRKRGVGSFVRPPEESSKKYELHSPSVSGKPVALMIPFSITRGGIFAAIQSASVILADAGLYLTLHVYTPGLENERKMLSDLFANADGVIYYPSTDHIPVDILTEYYDNKKPVIIIDKPNDSPLFSSVVCDNFSGSYMVTSHVLAYGHKKTCYLSRYDYDNMCSIKDRYFGYKKAIEDFDGDITPRFVKIDIPKNESFNYPLLKHIVNTLHNEGITAIICENDEVAFYVHMAIRSLGLKPVDDMSITGFDNIEWATTASADITTVSQNFSEIGKGIAQILLQDDYQPEHKVIPATLVPRTSTGPAPVG